jgi:5-methylcytosine-specific restriction endonuclease McrA
MPWDNNAYRGRHLPPNWGSVRTRVLNRDKRRCKLSLPGCQGKATDVDHIGDKNDHSLENLQAVCRPCHNQKTSRQGVDAQRRMRERSKRSQGRHPGQRR